MSSKTKLVRRQLTLLPLLLLCACSGGGGGGGGTAKVLPESEPNDTTTQADPLAVGRPGVGEVDAAGDVDCWSLRLTSGRYVEVELFAARLDQSGWDSGPNVPRLTLFDTDGTTKLLEHDYGGFVSTGWDWGAHDLDLPLFRVPATGTYFVCVAQDDAALAGGGYAVRVRYLTPAGAKQQEFEAAGTTGANDTPNTSEPIVPGVVHGFHVDDGSDYYAITIVEPTIVHLELHAYRNGVHGGDDDYFDPQLSLYDVDGLTVLATDDDSFFFDSALEFLVALPGDYYVQVTEFGGTGDGDYVLTYTRSSQAGSTESEPNDTPATADPFAYDTLIGATIDVGEEDFFRFAGTAGDIVRLQLFDGFNVQGLTQTIAAELLEPDGVSVRPSGGNFGLRTLTTILQQTGDHFVRITPAGTLTDYRLRLSRFRGASLESEPNDAIVDANPLDTRAAGVVLAPGDVDVFQFIVPQDRLVTIAIHASATATASDGFFEYSGHGSSLAPLLTITDPLGAVIATSTSTPSSTFTECVTDGLPTAAVSFVSPTLGPYQVHVESATGAGSATETYVVEKR